MDVASIKTRPTSITADQATVLAPDPKDIEPRPSPAQGEDAISTPQGVHYAKAGRAPAVVELLRSDRTTMEGRAASGDPPLSLGRRPGLTRAMATTSATRTWCSPGSELTNSGYTSAFQAGKTSFHNTVDERDLDKNVPATIRSSRLQARARMLYEALRSRLKASRAAWQGGRRAHPGAERA